ncbi:MAG: Bug family tripartite tricarboxylate transporter substrate binding protein [Burkholderiaceae bacterium]
MDRRRSLAALATLSAMSAIGRPGAAQQTWPAKPIRMIVAYPPGGASDTVARLLGPKLAAALGTQVVVENRGGAAGSIGMDAVAKAASDGYTIGFAAVSPLTLNPHVMRVAYDPQKDVIAVASVMFSPVYLMATPLFSGKRFDDIISQSRAHPGGLRVASSGVASVGHLMLEQIRERFRIDITHVPYKGAGQVLTDALSGQFELFTTNPNVSLHPHIERGTLRLLAVGAPKRLDSYPQVPTLAELDAPAANLTSTFGLFAPAGTAPEIIRRLNDETNKALTDTELRERMLRSDNVPAPTAQIDFARLILNEYVNNAQVVKAANIRLD